MQHGLSADRYASGTFWLTAAVVLLTLALIGLGIWAVRRQSPKRQLTYRFGPTVPMLASRYASQVQVQWTSQAGVSEQLLAPYVAGVTLTNSGRADTGTAAFDGNRPISVRFGSGARILAPLEVLAPNDIPVEIINNTLAIGPGLIKKGEQISVTLLAEGHPSYSIDAPLIDFDVASTERSGTSNGFLSSLAALLGYSGEIDRKPHFRILMITVVAYVLAAAALGVAVAALRSKKTQVTVPSFRNEQVSTAAGELAAIGLKPGQVFYQPSTTIPKGDVISSVPAANKKVDEGSTIVLVVSNG